MGAEYAHPDPVRYGIATLTAVPHLLLRLRARLDGQPLRARRRRGYPKWFTKDPQAPFRQEVEDMLRVIRHGTALAVEAGTQPTAFDLWWAIYRAQTAWGVAQRYPPLLSGLGASLVERALMTPPPAPRGYPRHGRPRRHSRIPSSPATPGPCS